MKLDTNVALQGFTQIVRNIIMACYTAHLASGQTLLCRAIKTETIKKYLKAATDLSLPFQMMNPTLNLLGNQSKYIGDILHEASRWESMPNRREPLTKDMVVYILDKGSAMDSADNLYTVMGDWLTLGLQTGARRQEWAQDRTTLQRSNHVDLNVDGSPTAFIESDFEFRGFNGLRLSTDSLPSLDLIATVRITWRYQKNMDNGQVITYAKDSSFPKLCAVNAAHRIISRAHRLGVAKSNPIAVFPTTRKSKRQCMLTYIDDVHIKSLLQEAATSLYKITSKEDLARFTSHSVRVGACVLLHVNGVSTDTIKFRLRWRSDAFKAYLRNVDALAEQHRNVLRNV